MISDNIVAIHQPNFFPWLGFFAKIIASDTFVFLDDVQFPKKGGVWTNRVKILMGNRAQWATVAIDRDYHGTRLISEIRSLSNNPWRTKLLKTIEQNYRSHPNYIEVMEVITPLLLNPEENLATYNIDAIMTISRCLGIDTNKFRRSSELPYKGVSNESLCSITKLVGGSVYMCGGGAEGYQDEAVFKLNNLVLMHQNFVHPAYSQHRGQGFVAGLSIVDAAMNLGWDGVLELLDQSTC